MVEYGDSPAYAQRQGKWWGYWAEMPTPGEEADDIRCSECREIPNECVCGDSEG